MIDLGWSAPERRVDAGTALRGILWQHRHIRTLLDQMRAVAEAALDGKAPSPNAVASAIGAVRSIMEVHLAFEETVLLPILRDDPPLGPQRADRLLDEHARQRTTLATLHDEARAYPRAGDASRRSWPSSPNGSSLTWRKRRSRSWFRTSSATTSSSSDQACG